MKIIKIISIVILALIITGVHAQPKRIGNSNAFWELVVEGNDSTLKFTGNGKLNPDNLLFFSIRKNIKKIEIAEGITAIGSNVFRDWDALEKVSLPQSLKVINSGAFENDSNIKNINLPKKLEVIKQTAFYKTGGLPDSIYLREIINFGSRNNIFISANTFSYTSIRCVELPYKTDTIFTNFQFCSKLSTVIIPATVNNFTGGTFYNDTALKLVVNLNPVPQTFEVPRGHNNAFDKVNRSKCRLLVPTSAVDLYKNTPVWQDFLIEGGGLSAGVTVSGKNKGNVSGVEYRLYKSAEKITWKAEPVVGCTFLGWKSNKEWISNDPTISFTITRDTLIEAVFDGEPLSVPTRSGETGKVCLYPNPAQTQFTVHSDYTVIGITIFDLSGRKVLRVDGNTVNVSEMARGVYMVEIRTGEGRYMKKFVRQ